MQYIDGKQTKDSFKELLLHNNGVIIIKFGASWCEPCQKLEPTLNQFLKKMPSTVTYVHIDIDHSIELYGFLKTKRVLNSIPTLLMYEKDNVSHVPTDLIIGGDTNQLTNILNNWIDIANSYL